MTWRLGSFMGRFDVQGATGYPEAIKARIQSCSANFRALLQEMGTGVASA